MSQTPLNILRQVLNDEALALGEAAIRLDESVAQKLVLLFQQLILEQGSLVFCGVGKSGHVAQKIASTFSSLGLSSWFLHPTEALHGDLGRLNKSDAIVFISKSGNTEEIVKLLPYLQTPIEKRLGILGHTSNDIAQKVGIVLDASITKEACLNNLAPTTSTTLAMSLGDAMAVLYEHVSGLSRESFAMNHPGGLLGKTLLLKVQDLMISVDDICLLEPHQTMNDVLIGMTSKPNGIACVVNKEKELLGIIVEGDIRRILTQHQDIKSLQVSQVMNLKPFSIEQWELAKEALELMESKGKSISVLPVLSGKKLVGILRLHDLVRQGLKG